MIDDEEKIYSDLAIPPGEYLKEVMEYNELSISDLTEYTGLDEEFISNLLIGKEFLTVKVAEKLSRVFKINDHIWLGLEDSYRHVLNKNKEEVNE